MLKAKIFENQIFLNSEGAKQIHLPNKLNNVSNRLPSFSTSQTPTKVKLKLTKAVAADNQIAVELSRTPVIFMILAL
jgi:hypothetical protein